MTTQLWWWLGDGLWHCSNHITYYFILFDLNPAQKIEGTCGGYILKFPLRFCLGSWPIWNVLQPADTNWWTAGDGTIVYMCPPQWWISFPAIFLQDVQDETVDLAIEWDSWRTYSGVSNSSQQWTCRNVFLPKIVIQHSNMANINQENVDWIGKRWGLRFGHRGRICVYFDFLRDGHSHLLHVDDWHHEELIEIVVSSYAGLLP